MTRDKIKEAELKFVGDYEGNHYIQDLCCHIANLVVDELARMNCQRCRKDTPMSSEFPGYHDIGEGKVEICQSIIIRSYAPGEKR